MKSIPKVLAKGQIICQCGGEWQLEPRASFPKSPLPVGQQCGLGTVTKDSVPVLRPVSSNREPTMAPQVYAEEHELLIRDPQPHGFLAIAYPLYRQPGMDRPAWHPSQEWHGHPSAATQRAWGPRAHVRACDLAGGNMAATAMAFLRPESIF